MNNLGTRPFTDKDGGTWHPFIVRERWATWATKDESFFQIIYPEDQWAKKLSKKTMRPKFPKTTYYGKANECFNCGCGGSRHSKRPVNQKRPCLYHPKCTEYIPQCMICEGWSKTVLWAGRRHGDYTERICRLCRNYIKRKEKETWQRRAKSLKIRRAARESARRELESWKKGTQTMRRIQMLLRNPERLQSAVAEYAPERTSRTL